MPRFPLRCRDLCFYLSDYLVFGVVPHWNREYRLDYIGTDYCAVTSYRDEAGICGRKVRGREAEEARGTGRGTEVNKDKIENVRAYYQHCVDTSYGSGGFTLSWGRKASAIIVELLDELEQVPEYEYAMQFRTGAGEWITADKHNEQVLPDFWGTKEERTEKMEYFQKAYPHIPFRLIKRRKAGPVEDYIEDH